jgi:DNA-binding response OmpR family regulator
LVRQFINDFFINQMSGQNEKTKILLVEDSEDDAFFFNLALERSGSPCNRDHVVDGAQAIEYIEQAWKTAAVPDMIFLDLKLPILTGFEVLEWIGQQDFHPRLNVVILSGSDHQGDIVRARELGANDYLVKPVSAEELKKRLDGLRLVAQLPLSGRNAHIKASTR